MTNMKTNEPGMMLDPSTSLVASDPTLEARQSLYSVIHTLRQMSATLDAAAVTSQTARVAAREMTDEQIVKIWQGMPGGPDGWLKHFGFIQFARAVLAATPVPCATDLLEEIAQSWDGCEYDGAGAETMDIGAALRQQFARFTAVLASSATAQQPPAQLGPTSEWRGIRAVLTNLIAVANVRITDKDDEDDQLIADAEEAVRQIEARLANLPLPGAAQEVQVEHGSAGDAAAAQAEHDAREIAAIWDSAKAEAAMYVEAHCVDGEVHAKHIMEQPRPKVAPPLPKTGIAAADVTRAQRDLVHYATSGDAGLAAACARAQVVIERLLSGLDVAQLS